MIAISESDVRRKIVTSFKKWSSFRYEQIFDILIGKSIDLNKLEEFSDGINYVGRTEDNNGITAKVVNDGSFEIYQGGCITVPMVGNELKSSYQKDQFCVSQNIAILRPRSFKLNMYNALFLNTIIRQDIFRFAYGRTLSLDRLRALSIRLPVDSLDNPDWGNVEKYMKNIINIPLFIRSASGSVIKKRVLLKDNKWLWFRYDNLFEIKKGKRLTKEDMVEGKTVFIGSSEQENGVTAYIGKNPIHTKNTISVTYNGSVAEAFYQPNDFWASDDVNVLYPKFSLNPYIALFILPLIKKEKYRFNYGRKWHLERMNESKIKLPVDKNGSPDWRFMEDYIKSLPYSASL